MEEKHNFDYDAMHTYLKCYSESGNIEDFCMFIKSGAMRFVLLIARNKFRSFKKELAKTLEQEAINIVLDRLMRLRKVSIIDIKNYLYTATINASYDIIKKYRLYEDENSVSHEEKGNKTEYPKHALSNDSEMMSMYYENLRYFLTQQMEPEPMKPYQAYVFIEFIKGFSCKEIACYMPDRKFEIVKSDLQNACKVLKTDSLEKNTILTILEGSEK